MNTSEISYFTEQYKHKNEEEILFLYDRISTLTEEAQISLKSVIEDRKINITQLKSDNVIQDNKIQEIYVAKEKNKVKWDSLIFKLILFLGAISIIFGLFFNPDRTYVSFISSITQALLLAAFSKIYIMIRDRISKNKKDDIV